MTSHLFRRAAPIALAAVALFLSPGHAQPQPSATRAITIAWDANPEPGVAGYLVHVEGQPGGRPETFDVGGRTSFTYSDAVEGRRYVFAVSAYFPGPIVGPRSATVSTTVGSPMIQSSGAGQSATSTTVEPPASEDSVGSAASETGNGVVCAEAAPARCFTRRLRASGLGEITAMAALDADRLILVDSGRHLRIVGVDPRMVPIALSVPDERVRVTGVAVDPGFARTGHVFVGVAVSRDGRGGEFSVMRYREVRGTLGEGAAVVSGLALSGPAEPIFTLDAEGRIYVAMPAGGADPYGGHVLRFNPDGSVPREHRAASPVLAYGFDAPSALAVGADGLWLAGADRRWPHTVARLSLASPEGDDWPRRPAALRIPASPEVKRVLGLAVGPRAGTQLAVVDARARLLVALGADHDSRGDVTTMMALTFPHDAVPVAVATGPRQQILTALRLPDGTHEVVELSDARPD